MTSRQMILGVLVASLASTAVVAADPTPVALFEGSGLVAVQPTGTGYAAVYLDGPGNTFWFVRLNAEGVPVDVPRSLGDLGLGHPDRLDLEPTSGGFLVLSSGAYEGIVAQAVDGDGAAIGGPRFVAEPADILDWDSASGHRARIVLLGTYDWSSGWRVLSQPVAEDGAPDGAAHRVHFEPPGPGGLFESVRVVSARGGFETAWSRHALDVLSRDLKNSGAPQRSVLNVASAVDCVRWATPVSGDSSAVLYRSGCEGSEALAMRVRYGNRFHEPVVLDTGYGAPYSLSGLNPIFAAPDRGRMGVLVTTPPDASDVSGLGRPVFAEFNFAGERLAPPLDLYTSYGFAGRVSWLIYDEARAVYVAAWVGEGPGGSGAYTLRISPTP